MMKRVPSKSKFIQGVFNPMNKDKYKGHFPIIYRSSWELSMFRFLDRNSKCINWGSESTVINYFFNGDNHRYFIDLSAVMMTKDGPKKFLIEIKPYRQTIPPVKSAKKKEKTLLTEQFNYEKNIAKWKAAKEYARVKGSEFIIFTEKDLYLE